MVIKRFDLRKGMEGSWACACEKWARMKSGWVRQSNNGVWYLNT